MYARDTGLIATPIGMVRVSGTNDVIESVSIGNSWSDQPPATSAAVRAAIAQIEEWFAGNRRDFDLPLAPSATPRCAVLRQAMVEIGYGDTISYGALAKLIGSSARAIGQACARNPFPIIVPCHRVLNANGSLGAYSGGDGPATKSHLLDHERRHAGLTLL